MTGGRAAPERLPVGGVGKPHGLDGSFYVTRPVPALLRQGIEIFVDGETEPRTVERRAGTDERPILRLSGSTGRDTAELLRGKLLEVSSDAAPPLGEDEYWAHELVGAVVVAAGTDERLGDVAELQALPSCEVLRVTGGPRGELLVPMVRNAIVDIDVEQARVTVDAEFLALDE